MNNKEGVKLEIQTGWNKHSHFEARMFKIIVDEDSARLEDEKTGVVLKFDCIHELMAFTQCMATANENLQEMANEAHEELPELLEQIAGALLKAAKGKRKSKSLDDISSEDFEKAAEDFLKKDKSKKLVWQKNIIK